MKKSLLLALAGTALLGLCPAAHAQMLVINEVYSGGGSGAVGTTYTRDFVEIYNSGTTPVQLGGYALQYASAAGTFTNTIVIFGAGSVIAAGDYFSVATGSAGAAGATLTSGTGAGNVTYVVPGVGGASLSNSGGSVRLYNTNTAVTVDVIGFGSATQGTSPVTDPKFETAVAPAPTNTTTSLDRTNFVDTNNNSVDFTNLTTVTPNGGTAGTVYVAPVPEPSTWAAMIGGTGILALALRRRRLA